VASPLRLVSSSISTKMPPTEIASLLDILATRSDLSTQALWGEQVSYAWADLVAGSVLGGRSDELRARSVLVVTADQVTAAAILVELDGLASRVVLYPPDLGLHHLPYVAEIAAVDAIVSDQEIPNVSIPVITSTAYSVTRSSNQGQSRRAGLATEWVLLTSGTTGRPKLVAHTLASLTGAIKPQRQVSTGVVWSTFYDIRRYGGLQIFLRAIISGTSLVLSGVHESAAQFLARVGARGVTHISGTPSHWRRVLMSSSAHLLSPDYVRLSGEIADQAVLDQLRSLYPHAQLSHAFASTEAGVAFEVRDHRSGFEQDVIRQTPGVDMKVENGTLRIRSDRTASRYLNQDCGPLKDAAGFVDTGDVLELRENRYHFVGRRDGVINVGGSKVHPEEIEEVINRHPQVHMSLVRTRKNGIMGSLVVADVVLNSVDVSQSVDRSLVQRDILSMCRGSLPAYKVPFSINFVSTLEVAETGKLVRRYA
jgi:acyl-coenzyme A synthetase/AMP-(fatty) acid ligase